MPNKSAIRFDKPCGVVTVTRADLVTLTRRIIKSIPDHMLFDRDRPFTIAIDGTFSCGKKLVADITRDTIFPGNERFKLKLPMMREQEKRGIVPDCKMTGRPEQWEYATGNYNGRSLTVSFMNCVAHKTIADYLRERPTTEGIAMLNNAGPAERQDADITIWIESEDPEYALVHASDKSHIAPDSPNLKRNLTRTHRRAAKAEDNKWLRYVEIQLNNKTLQALPDFKALITDANLNNTKTPVNIRDIGVFHVA